MVRSCLIGAQVGGCAAGLCRPPRNISSSLRSHLGTFLHLDFIQAYSLHILVRIAVRMEVSEPPAKRRKTTPCAGHRPVTRASLARTQQDDSTLPAYTYRALKKEDEIRIFKVEKTGPGEWQYDIEHTTLTDAPPFETVSYVWGPDTRRNILRLRYDRTIRINDNLAKALPYLSAECKTGYLWIDQISINQSSTQERNHQVKMMGDIYKNGERVVAWLGAGEKPSKQLLALIEVTQTSMEARETLPLTKAKIRECLLKCRSRDVVTLSRLLQSAWFSRAWVFQEIVLSKHATFLFGDMNVPFLALVWISKVSATLRTHDFAPLRQVMSTRQVQYPFEPNLYHDIASTRGYNILSMMHLSWHAVSHTLSDSVLPFISVLSKVSPILQTTDDKDSVYAFLGLHAAQYSTAPIEVDYGSTYEQALTNTAISIIQSMRSLEILSYCERERSRAQPSRRLPSWVPEWRAPIASPLLVSSKVGYSVCGRHGFVESQNPFELRVRGRRLDTISVCCAPTFQFRTDSWYSEHLKDYLNLDQRLGLIKEHISCSRERLLETLLTRMYRPDVPLKDFHETQSDYNTKDLLDVYDDQVNKDSSSRYKEESHNLRALRYRTYLVNNRQLFLTKGGHLGHVRQPSEGDMICTLQGFRHLIVLRPSGNNRFTVVGTCHVEDQLWDLCQLTTNTGNYADTFWEKHEGEEYILA